MAGHKPIIINDTNRARIETAIAEAEGKATARTITFDNIVHACERIEKKLGVTKKAMEGVYYDVDLHAQNFPNAYKYRAESTQFTVEFSKGKWRLVSIGRSYTRREGHQYKCLAMPEETKQAIIDRMMDFW